ncbi:cold-shock protein [Amycolatopsis orientalis]|uniref:cold-shock protein n=1 Tax=Amycolatopsis orientalis TaxID=31958 RepID=UPI00039A01C7|nr:cold shock domain-containing protein [Amycolatopsis orientalis]
MEHRGKVARWEVDEGWGILESPAVDGPVWAHFSMIEAEGFRYLTVGEDVRFTVERAAQDGCHWRAIRVRAA